MNLTGEAWLTSPKRRRNDIKYARLLLPLLAPLALAGAFSIVAIDGYDPLLRQRRIGRDNTEFNILKLRTMPPETPHIASNGATDARATRCGRALRISRLDEVPQLINVLRGDMSIVGPRPLLRNHIDEIAGRLKPSTRDEWLTAREICLPGIINPLTVAIQYYGRPPTDETRAESEIDFANNASPVLDRQMVHDAIASTFGRTFLREQISFLDTAFRK